MIGFSIGAGAGEALSTPPFPLRARVARLDAVFIPRSVLPVLFQKRTDVQGVFDRSVRLTVVTDKET
jgi:hypothetical protein